MLYAHCSETEGSLTTTKRRQQKVKLSLNIRSVCPRVGRSVHVSKRLNKFLFLLQGCKAYLNSEVWLVCVLAHCISLLSMMNNITKLWHFHCIYSVLRVFFVPRRRKALNRMFLAKNCPKTFFYMGVAIAFIHGKIFSYFQRQGSSIFYGSRR